MEQNRNKTYRIWQWNCRGFKNKRGNLQQYINLLTPNNPDVIALQETNGQAKLPGFSPYSSTPSSVYRTKRMGVTTLIRRNIPVIQHSTDIDEPENVK